MNFDSPEGREAIGRLLGRRPRPRVTVGTMNQAERAYAQTLDAQKLADEIVDWRYEPLRLRLAPKTYYTPDFLVVTGYFELHEVKGHWEDDARVKWKCAAELFPWFRFVALRARKRYGRWTFEEEQCGST